MWQDVIIGNPCIHLYPPKNADFGLTEATLRKINFIHIYSCIHTYYYHIYCPGLLRYYKTTSKKQYISSYEMKSEHFISAESLESAVAKRRKVLTQGE